MDMTPSGTSSPDILAQNIARYEWVRGRALGARRRGDLPKAVGWAYLAGYCGWHGHAGRYADPLLERMLHDIGRETPSGPGPLREGMTAPSFSRTRWLHVVSTALPIGGHTRLVQQWLRKDAGTDAIHSVILTDQRQLAVPPWLRETVAAGGGNLIELHPMMKIADRVAAIRRAIAEAADIIVLHTHPNDPLAVMACAVDGLPPVILMNHAEHLFWFGASTADVVADIRPWGQQTSLQRRRARRSEILPIPLDLPPEGSKEEARRRLGLPADAVVLLSVGSDFKFVPFGSQNFPAAAREILRRYSTAVIVVVGPDGSGPAWSGSQTGAGERLLLMGPREDISDYYRAADIYLECFPVGSHTASLDAILYGAPLLRAPVPPIEMLGLEKYDGMTPWAADQDEYCAQAGLLITDRSFRHESARLQKQAVMAIHGTEGWRAHRDHLRAVLPQRHDAGFALAEVPDVPDRHDHIWAELQARQEEGLILQRAYCDNVFYQSLLRFSRLERFWAKSAGRWSFHPELLAALPRR